MEEGVPTAPGGCKATSQGVSFMIGFDAPPRKQLPQGKARFLAQHQRGRERAKELTEDDLAERQRRADERRKKHTEERLERIHQREMEALSLARSVDPLLQHMTDGRGKGGMSEQQFRAQAVQAAQKVVAMNAQVTRELKPR